MSKPFKAAELQGLLALAIFSHKESFHSVFVTKLLLNGAEGKDQKDENYCEVQYLQGICT